MKKKRFAVLSRDQFERLSLSERQAYIRRQGSAIQSANKEFSALVELNRILLGNARKLRRRAKS